VTATTSPEDVGMGSSSNNVISTPRQETTLLCIFMPEMKKNQSNEELKHQVHGVYP